MNAPGVVRYKTNRAAEAALLLLWHSGFVGLICIGIET